MKHLLFLVTGCFFTLLSFAQLRPDSISKTGKGNTPAERYKKPTAANLPEGTYTKDNKVYIKPGYKGVYDASKKKVAIARINNGGGGTTTTMITGGFVCYCSEGTDDCIIVISGTTLNCNSKKSKCQSCGLTVTVDKPQVVLIMTESPGNLIWKNIEIPKFRP